MALSDLLCQVTVPPSNGVVTLTVEGTLDFTSYANFSVTISNTAAAPVSVDDIQLTYAMNETTNRVSGALYPCLVLD